MGILGKKHKENKEFKETFSLEMEISNITDKMVNELIGEDGEISRDFHRILAQQKLQPLEADTAKKAAEDLLLRYIQLAVAERGKFSKEISNAIWNGSIYQQYHKKMDEISDLTVSVYRKQQEMDAAEEDYLFQKKVYEKVLGQSFIEMNGEKQEKKASQIKGLWEKIFKKAEKKESELSDGGSTE